MIRNVNQEVELTVNVVCVLKARVGSSVEPRFDGKRCPACRDGLTRRDKTLFWEAMEFCDAKCLGTSPEF